MPPAHRDRLIRCPSCKGTFSVRLPAPPPRLDVAAATSAGLLRERNEDAFLTQQVHWADARGRHELALLLVADGMGGHASGDRASAAAVAAVAAALLPRVAELVAGAAPLPDDEGLIELVDHGLWQASRAIVRLGEEGAAAADAGATAVAALVLDGRAAVCHVGDCRAYRYRAGELKALTRDHTVAWRMVDLGQLSEAEAARQASPVAQALGRQHDFEPSRQALRLAAGEWLLLACDGLHGQVGDEAMAQAVASAATAAEAAAGLVRRADEAGGRDNCTVVAVRAVG